ncbi:MAG: hypothetical protein WB798_15225 [Nocardioidaceae bacterium]
MFRTLEREVCDALTGGRRHVLEARMKQARRTPGHPSHTTSPERGAGQARQETSV